MCLHPCSSNKGNSRKMCIHHCCRRQLYTGNKGTGCKMCLHPCCSRNCSKMYRHSSGSLYIVRDGHTPKSHAHILLRALVKKPYSNAQVFKPQSTICPQNLYRLLLQLIHCSTSIQYAVSFTRTLTLSHL